MNLNKELFKLKKHLLRPQVYFVPFIIFIVFSNEVLASEWSIKPRIELRNFYDTNRSLTTGPHDSMTGVSLIPSIDFNRDTDLTSNRITARLISTRYSDEDTRDRDVLNLGVRHKTKGLRNTFTIIGNYRQDTTLATLDDIEFDDESGLDDSSDPDLGLTTTEAKRKNLLIEPDWSYRMSESYSLGLNYRYRKRDYSDEADTGLVEFNANAYVLALKKILDEKNVISYVLRFSEYDPANNTKTEDTSIGLTYKHYFSKLSDIILVAGLRDTDSPTGKSDGSVYKITFNTRAEISRFNVELSKDLAGSGSGSVVEKVQVDVKYRQRLTQLTSLSIRARAFDNESIGNNTSADRRYLSIEPKLRLNLSRNFNVGFSYRYRKQKYDNNDQSADSNAVFLGVVYSFDKWATRL